MIETLISFPLRIEIPGLPPSVNHTYGLGRHGMFKNAKAREWERIAQIKIKTTAQMLFGTHDLSKYRGWPVSLELLFCRPSWRSKAGPKKGLYVRPDCSNFIKIVEDSVFKSLNLDDSAVVELMATKQECVGEPKTIIVFQFVPDFDLLK